MRSIGLGEALALWLSGQKLDGMALYGLSVVWWSRAAKIATYAAGLVVVLDLIGPAKIRAFGAREMVKPRRLYRVVVGTVYAVLLAVMIFLTPYWWGWGPFILISLGFGAVGALLGVTDDRIAVGIAKTLENGTSLLVVRISSVVVLTLAFAVDLLTS